MTTQLPARVAGATLPDTTIYWREDGTYLDLSAYSSWQIEARAATDSTAELEWTKTTGITDAAGSATAPNITIVWADADLGALTAGNWRLELTGIYGSGTRKLSMAITITDELDDPA